MTPLILLVLVVLVGFGCVCVVRAERGGPRWVRAVAALTLGLGRMARRSGKSRTRSGESLGTGDDGS